MFDGTFYHLWYLPAALMGCIILLMLMKLLGNRGAGIAVVLLYFAGLLGDSYYGLISDAPVLKSIYKGIFTISSYTRNGVFYIPIFLWMGLQFARLKERREGNPAKYFSKKIMTAGLGIFTG